MKVKLEFDSSADREQIVQLAVRAEAVYYLFDDLLCQLLKWVEENPSDQQGEAFEKTRRWLWDEILNRGLYVHKVKQAIIVDRAGNPHPTANQPESSEPHSKRE